MRAHDPLMPARNSTMISIETGDFQGPMTISVDREIHGSLRGPVSVQGSVCLVVRGALTGPVTIGPDAIVNVLGAYFDSEDLHNEGLLLIAGTTDHVFCEASGRIAVAVGSVLTDRDRPEIVGPDGTCSEVDDGPRADFHVHTEASDYVTYDSAAGVFRRLPAA